MSIEIAQFRREQMGELCEFLRLAYPQDVRKSDPHFLDWYYLRNLNVNIENIPLWIAVNHGKIVGQLATIAVQLKAGTAYAKAIWILEFMLREEFRGRGFGKQLVRAAQKQYPTMITLGINEASPRVFNSLGWVSLGSIHRYHKLLCAGSAARRLGNHAVLREALNWLSAPLRISLAKRRSADKYELKYGVVFGPEVDELWTRASIQWPCAVLRDHRFLTWRFLQQPGKVFDVIRLYENGKLLGYTILFFTKGRENGPPPKAAISDLVYDPENAEAVIGALLDCALELAIQRRAGSLVTEILDDKVEFQLKRQGFWRMKTSPRFMVSSSEFQDLMCKAGNWFLTRADADVSIF